MTIKQSEIERLKTNAQNGDSIAQNKLGLLYFYGEELERDFGKAFGLFQESANQGNYEAYYNLGNYYNCGMGGKVNLLKAYEHYLIAANQGNADAQHEIGDLYISPWVCNKNHEKAVEWFQKAINNGCYAACQSLGKVFSDKENKLLNYAKSFENYLLGARNGIVGCFLEVGRAYTSGTGIKQDLHKAIKWYNKYLEEKENTEAQFELASIYSQESEVKDLELAFSLFVKSAKKSHFESKIGVVKLYEEGIGNKTDYEMVTNNLNSYRLGFYRLAKWDIALGDKLMKEQMEATMDFFGDDFSDPFLSKEYIVKSMIEAGVVYEEGDSMSTLSDKLDKLIKKNIMESIGNFECGNLPE